MKLSRILLAALSVTALAAQADDADPRGQFAAAAAGQATRAEVQSQLLEFRKAGVNPWSIAYNPLKSFQSQASRQQVRADYIDNRAAVAGMTGEDSGSAWLKRPVAQARQVMGNTAAPQ